MTHFFMIHTRHGFEMQVFETSLEAQAGVDKLRQYAAYKDLIIDIVKVEPNVETGILCRSLPEED